MSKKKKPKTNGSTDFGKYEIMDRASIIMHNFDNYIINTDTVGEDDDLLKEANKIFDALHDFYQLAANKFWETDVKMIGAPRKLIKSINMHK